MQKLSTKESDILIEIANIGTGNASKSLEALSGCSLKPLTPELMLVNKTNAPKLFKQLGKKIVYGGIKLTGNISGQAIFIFPVTDAERLSSSVVKTKGLRGLHESAFKEIFNIFAGNYLSALADLLEITVLHSFPKILSGETNDILSEMYRPKDVNEVVCIKSIIEIGEMDISGYFLLIMDPKNLRMLIKFINKKF